MYNYSYNIIHTIYKYILIICLNCVDKQFLLHNEKISFLKRHCKEYTYHK